KWILPARIDRYEKSMLDTLCLTGEVGWARVTSATPDDPTDVVGATPIALFVREHADIWTTARATLATVAQGALKGCATGVLETGVLETLRTRGALFFHELVTACRISEKDLRTAISELVAAGLITSDGFAGLRAVVQDTKYQAAGRWSAIAEAMIDRDTVIERQAWALLRRYGVVFRRLLTREANAAPWRELTRVYRRLEARGEIRGGRFVTGMSGEQFALPEAVERLREIRRSARDGRCLVISAADPLNLADIVTSKERVRASAANRLTYRDNVPMAVLEGEFMHP